MASPSLSQAAGTARAAEQTGAVSYEKFAGWCALAAGVSGFLYSIAFIVLKDAGLSAFFLLYITEGIPLGFAATAVATQLRRQGVGPAEITLPSVMRSRRW